MRILFLTRHLGLGGAERQLAQTAIGLAARGHRVSVALFYCRGPLLEELRRHAVPVHDLRKRGRWDVVGFAWSLAKLIRRERPDVLYAYLTTSNVLAAVLGRLLRPRGRIVWGVRSARMDLARYDWLARLEAVLETWLAPLAHLVIVNSREGRAALLERRFPEARVVTIPNGIDVERFRPPPRTAHRARQTLPPNHRIGMVGRLDPMKDHPTFLAAAARLCRLRQDVEFVCIGSGPDAYREQLQAQAKALGLRDRLVWGAATDDVLGVYHALAIFTSSSYREGFPNVVAEAMACGLPCVVTDVGDSALIVGDPRWVVPPHSPEALCDAWERLLAMSPAEREALGRSNRERIAACFSVERMVSATEQALERLLPAAPNAR